MPKTVLITGAGSGFGRDAAIQLARRGHKVIAAVLNDQQAAAGLSCVGSRAGYRSFDPAPNGLRQIARSVFTAAQGNQLPAFSCWISQRPSTLAMTSVLVVLSELMTSEL